MSDETKQPDPTTQPSQPVVAADPDAPLEPVVTDTRPIWERLPPRHNDKHEEICCLPHCDKGITARHLCLKHYQALRRSGLDPESGLMLSEVKSNKQAADERKADLAKDFEGFDKYVYLYGTNELLHVDNGFKIPLSHAVTTWGREVKAACKDGRIKRYYREIFDPNNPGVHSMHGYNSYKPLPFLKPSTALEAPLEPILESLLLNIGGKNVDYLKDWIAFKIQNPQIVHTALVIHGVPGAGKNVLGELLKFCFAPHTMTVNAHTLENEFNAWMEQKFLIVADEITTKSLRERERTKNILKTYVVPGPVHINKKGINQYEINNHASWMIFSNSDHPVDIEPNDRRFTVLNAQNVLTKGIGGQIIKNKETLARNLIDHLAYRNLSNFDHNQPLENDARREVKNRAATTQDDGLPPLE